MIDPISYSQIWIKILLIPNGIVINWL